MKKHIKVYPIDFRNTGSNRKKKTTFSLSRILLGTFSLEIAISFLFYRNKTSIEKWCYVNVKLKLEIFRQNINFLYRSRSDNKTLLSKNCREFYQQKNVTFRYALYLLILYKKVRIWRGTKKEIHHKFVSGKWRTSSTAGKYQAYTA